MIPSIGHPLPIYRNLQTPRKVTPVVPVQPVQDTAKKPKEQK